MPKLQLNTSLKINGLPTQRDSPSNQSSQPGKVIEIFDGICLGSYDEATNKEVLVKNNISGIINCSPVECQNLFEETFSYLSLSISDKDTFDYLPFFNQAFSFINGQIMKGGKVLIHCFKVIYKI